MAYPFDIERSRTPAHPTGVLLRSCGLWRALSRLGADRSSGQTAFLSVPELVGL